MKIYVAASWRNPLQPQVVVDLRAIGHEVYDYRNPKPGDTGFSWEQIDPAWQFWGTREFAAALKHPIADAGYQNDIDAMEWADACVLVMPSGNSGHLEMGWFTGRGKPAIVYVPEGIKVRPELMYKLADPVSVCASMDEVIAALDVAEKAGSWVS